MEKKKYVYTYDRICVACNKAFQTHRYGTKTCSEECVSVIIAAKQTKYTPEQKEEAIQLRNQGMVIPEITKITGIKKPSLQKIFQEKGVVLNAQDKQKSLERRWLSHDPIQNGHKLCSKCNINKLIEEFHINRGSLTGLTSHCIACSKEHYKQNADTIKARVNAYRITNPEKIQLRHEKYYEENKDKKIELAKKWSSANPEKRKAIEQKHRLTHMPEKRARMALYRAKKKEATPPWMTDQHFAQIVEIYRSCPPGYHVDHDIPLCGDNVSGLHVPWNLKHVSARKNEGKNNRHYGLNISVGICHQYKRKIDTLEEDLANGRILNPPIQEFELSYEKFSKEHALFIQRYEWLGTAGYATKWAFTARHLGVLGGVILISEPNGLINRKDGNILEAQIDRGATASWTPKNLGSKLLMFSCKWMTKNTTKRVFSGFSDNDAGEVGTIYQACNFIYLGATFGAKHKYVRNDGKEVTSGYFRKTSTWKRYAKELGIVWQANWTKLNKIADKKAIPEEIKNLFKKRGEEEKVSFECFSVRPKGKYVLILGKNRRDRSIVDSLYASVFERMEPYPKRDDIIPHGTNNAGYSV